MTKTSTPQTVEDLEHTEAEALKNFRLIHAGNYAAVHAKILEKRTTIRMHEVLARTGDRDAALADGKMSLPEHSPAQLAHLLDPVSLTRARAALPALVVQEAEAWAAEEEAEAAARTAMAALDVAYAEQARAEWREFSTRLTEAADEFLSVLARNPRVMHPDGIDVGEVTQLGQRVRGVALRLARRVGPAPAEAKGLRGWNGEPLKPNHVLVRVLADSLFDPERNTRYAKNNRVDFDQETAKDLIRRNIAEAIA
jgi:hypothetical protein